MRPSLRISASVTRDCEPPLKACFDCQSFFRFASDALFASCPALLAASFMRFQKSFGICLVQRIRTGDGVTHILERKQG